MKKNEEKIVEFAKFMAKEGYKEIKRPCFKGGFYYPVSKKKEIYWVTNGRSLIGAPLSGSTFPVSKTEDKGMYKSLVEEAAETNEEGVKCYKFSWEKIKELYALPDTVKFIEVGERFYPRCEFLRIYECLPLEEEKITITQKKKNGFISFVCPDYFSLIAPTFQKIKETEVCKI